MCPNVPLKSLKKQAGFGMPVAVFVLVIMALLAAAIVQLASRSHFSATQEEISNRAFYAGESGASWGLSRLFFNSAGVADRAFSDAVCDAMGASPSLAGASGLAGCTVAVTCECKGLANCAVQTAGAANHYTLVSTGTCGSGQVRGLRTIQVGAKNQ